MILTKTCNYAIRALLYVATRKESNFVPVREISQQLNISFHFLSKIHLILIQHHLTTSSRGAKGGVSLASPAEDITIYDIIEAVDGDDIFQNCVLGLENCSDDHPCPLHDSWSKYRLNLKKIFQEVTLADLAEKINKEQVRLSNIRETFDS